MGSHRNSLPVDHFSTIYPERSKTPSASVSSRSVMARALCAFSRLLTKCRVCMCQGSCRPRKKTTHNHQIWAPQIARFGVAGTLRRARRPGYCLRSTLGGHTLAVHGAPARTT